MVTFFSVRLLGTSFFLCVTSILPNLVVKQLASMSNSYEKLVKTSNVEEDVKFLFGELITMELINRFLTEHQVVQRNLVSQNVM